MKKTALILTAIILSATVAASCGAKNSIAVYTDAPEYTVGVQTASGYESEWSGIKFTPSDNVTMSDDSELEEIEAMGDGAVYEMMATDNINYDTVLVRTLSADGMSFEDYINEQSEGIKEQFEANGLTVTCEELDNHVFGGREYNGALYTVTMNDTSIYQCVYRAMLGDHICEVYFTYADEAAFNGLMDCFE